MVHIPKAYDLDHSNTSLDDLDIRIPCPCKPQFPNFPPGQPKGQQQRWKQLDGTLESCTVCPSPSLHFIQWLLCAMLGRDQPCHLCDYGSTDCTDVNVSKKKNQHVILFANLCFARRLKNGEKADERTLLARIKAYRQLQVLQGIASDAISKVIQGQKLLCLTLVIRCLYGTIMVRDPQRWRLVTDVIGHLGFLHSVFKAVAYTYERSEEALENWKSQRHNGLFRRMHRSCTPLKMRIGGMYHVDQSMMLSMWSFILNGTVNLVLTGSVL